MCFLREIHVCFLISGLVCCAERCVLLGLPPFQLPIAMFQFP